MVRLREMDNKIKQGTGRRNQVYFVILRCYTHEVVEFLDIWISYKRVL